MKNALFNTTFMRSITQGNNFDSTPGYEVAIIGRSNAGKSSAINKICNNKKLAKISKTPGRTQAVNLFQVALEKRIADLPGYGYANVNVNTRKQWDQLLNQYFLTRRSLRCVFLIVDIRRGLGSGDIQVIDWILGIREQMPIYILFTKSDKLSRNQAIQTLRDNIRLLEGHQYTDIDGQLFSAIDGSGLSEARAEINKYLNLS